MVPPQINFIGDHYRGGAYLGLARELLRRLEHRMSFNGLQQGEDFVVFPDGVRVDVRIVFGLSSITIDCPVEVTASEKQEWDIHEYDYVKGHFFVKFIVTSPPVEHDPDLPPPPPQPPKTECVWVVFDKNVDDGFYIATEGQVIEKKMFGQIPRDAQKNVGAQLSDIYKQLTGTLTTQNFGGKAFNLSRAGTKRFCGYTGNTPLLFRDGKLIYKGAPCLEVFQDEFFPTVYMGNMHKMLVQNDKHVAWYYFKQEPYFIMGIRGEMDMRFTVCVLDLVSVVGKEHETCAPTPRARMRGGSSGVDIDATTSYTVDAGGQSALNGWLSDWQAPWAGWYQILQFPQGLHALLDVKEIDPRSFEKESWVTLFMCSRDALVESTYDLNPDVIGDHGSGFGYSYGGFQPLVSPSTVVGSSFTWFWSPEGFKKYDSIAYEFYMKGYNKWPRICQEVHREDGNQYRVDGLFGFDQCHFYPHKRYGGMLRGSGGPNAGCAVFLPYSGSIAYSLGFYYSGVGNGRTFDIFKKYIGTFLPFSGTFEKVQRFYRTGEFSVGMFQVGNGQIWGEPKLGYNEGGSQYALCAWTYYQKELSFVFRWQYGEAECTNLNDTNNFDFLWHEMYNDPWATGVEIFCPNIIVEKGRRRFSACNAKAMYRDQFSGPHQDISSHDMWWGFAAPIPDWWVTKGYIEDWLSPYPGIPYTCSDADLELKWEEITGYLSGGGERMQGNWSKDCSDPNNEKVHATDGTSRVMLPAQAWEYYFMDDRSVNEEAQGVFIACKTGVNWRFFHFWENSGTMREITSKLFEKLGFVTPQQRVSIQCIGVI